MHFAREMEFNCGVIGSFCIQEPLALCQVHKMAVFVYTRISPFESCEFFQFFRVYARYPACFIKWKCIKLNRSSIFLQQTILNYFELQFTHTANDLFISTMLSK